MKKIILILITCLTVTPFSSHAISIEDRKSVNQDTTFYQNADLSSNSCVGEGTAELDGHKLPATKGGTGEEEIADSSGYVASGGRVAFHQFANLGPEYGKYYINMRWRFRKWNWDGTDAAGPENGNWYAEKPRKVLVTNPRTKKSIVLVILDSGPAPWTGVDLNVNNDPKQGWVNPQDGTPKEYKGRVSGMPKPAMQAIGATMRFQDGSGDDLIYSWAPDQNAKPGPVSTPSNISEASDCDEIADADIIQYKPRLGTTGKIRPTAIVLHWWAYNAPDNTGIRSLVNGLRSNRDCGAAGCSVQLGILRDGKTYQLTNSLTSRALHATCANEFGIGIEIEGKPSDFGASGPEKRPEQFKAVVSTVKYLMEKYDIPLEATLPRGVHSHKQTDQYCNSGYGKDDVDDAYLSKVKEAVQNGAQ